MKRFLVLALLALPTAAAQTADEKKATLAYLHGLQDKSGAFRLNAKTEKPSLRATSASLRALRYFASFRGGNARNWLLQVVRHTCHTWMWQHRERAQRVPFDDELDSTATEDLNPEVIYLRHADAQQVRPALEELPIEYREVLVLREMEALSYQEIAAVAGIPLGTVMSRLARGRKLLQQRLAGGRGALAQDGDGTAAVALVEQHDAARAALRLDVEAGHAVAQLRRRRQHAFALGRRCGEVGVHARTHRTRRSLGRRCRSCQRLRVRPR